MKSTEESEEANCFSDCSNSAVDMGSNFARKEFNKNRKFIIQNVPPVTYEEVKEYIGGFGVSNISISKKCRHAVVTLLHGEQAEEAVHLLSQSPLHDTKVEVLLYPNESFLCVTHLPFSLSEAEFRKEMEQYGTLEKCFLMRYDQTGESMGYGFVQYVHNKEKSREACEMLDGKRIDSSIIQCSFLQPSVLSFEDLRSSCLLIDHLPPDYYNLQELQNICSAEVEPIWCQLGKKENQYLGFAIVEYSCSDEAEAAQKRLNGHQLSTTIIKATFCRPGEKAENLYKEMVDIRLKRIPPPFMPPENPAGLTVNPNLASPVVKNLLMNNPDALDKFVELLNLLQLQILQQQHQQLQASLMGPLMNPHLQIALLAVLMAQQIQESQPGFVADPTTQHFILNGLHNQQRSQKTQDSQAQDSQASLLGSPLVAEANSMLQNVFSEKNTKSEDKMNANPPKPGAFNLFPGPDGQSITTDTLTDFNQLVSALTPGKETTGVARTARSQSTSSDSNVKNNNPDNVIKCEGASSITSTAKDNVLPGKLSAFGSATDANNSIVKSEVNDKFKQQGENILQTVHDPSPLFNVSGVGFANPFLASFIENQIKHQVQQMHQSAPKPVSLMDLALTGTNPLGWQRQHMLHQTTSRMVHGKPGLLGEPPNMGKLPSLHDDIQSTPTSYKPPSLMGNMAEKRTLSFDDNKPVPKSNPQTQSLLGEPPASLPRLDNLIPPTTGSWEGFCKNLAQNSSSNGGQDGEPANKQRKLKSLLDVDLTQTNTQDFNTWGQGTNPNTVEMGQTQGTARASESWQNYGDPYYSQTYQNYMMQCHKVFDEYMQQNYSSGGHHQQQTSNMNYTSTTGDDYYSQYTGTESYALGSKRKAYNQERDGHSMSTPQQTSTQRKIAKTTAESKPKSLLAQATISAPPLLNANTNRAPPYQTSASVTGENSLYPPNQSPHLIPSPEPSPNGQYVGQHSQGLGGHYAENYMNRYYSA